MQRFRELTTGHAVVMGRRTYESIPDALPAAARPPQPRAQPRRVVPRRGRRGLRGRWTPRSPPAAGDCFVIGGGATYARGAAARRPRLRHRDRRRGRGRHVLPGARRPTGACVEPRRPSTENGHTFSFVTYERALIALLPRRRAHRGPAARRWATLEARGRLHLLPRARRRATRRSRSSTAASTGTSQRNDFPYAGTVAHYLIVPAPPRRRPSTSCPTRRARSCGRSSGC